MTTVSLPSFLMAIVYLIMCIGRHTGAYIRHRVVIHYGNCGLKPVTTAILGLIMGVKNLLGLISGTEKPPRP